mgnify:CR=1 FL=1|tara:strand:- start:14394 stop:14549 length:156 start_codon:yes stop_codon:yes gene_type:complete
MGEFIGAIFNFIFNFSAVIFLLIVLAIFGWNFWTGFLTFLVVGGVIGLFAQ